MPPRTIAGRLAGAFRNAGQQRIADDVVQTMERAGYTIRETDPFEDAPGITLSTREVSPYVNRIRLACRPRCPDIGETRTTFEFREGL